MYQKNTKRALTINEAAEYACVSRGTIENWMTRDILPYEELPGVGKGSYRFIRIRQKDLKELLDSSYKNNYTNKSSVTSNKLILLPRNT